MKWLLAVFLCTFLLGCTSVDNAPVIDVSGDEEDPWDKPFEDTVVAMKIDIFYDAPDSLAYEALSSCENRAVDINAACESKSGWGYSNALEITDFSRGVSDGFEIFDAGGCERPDDSVQYPPTVISESYDSSSDVNFQVICSIECVHWDCPGEKKESTPQSLKDINSLKCPPVTGFLPGNIYNPGFSGARETTGPSLQNAWGRETQIFCNYYRDSGKREWSQYGDGDIIYEGVQLHATFQVDGTFSARPDWGRESYCTGASVNRAPHIDIYSSDSVALVTYLTRTDYDDDVSGVMQNAAQDLLSEIEEKYAIGC